MLTAKGGKTSAFKKKKVSWTAKGVYGFMIFTKRKPEFTFAEINEYTNENKTKTMCALAELEKNRMIVVRRNVYPYRYCIIEEDKEDE